MTKTLMAYHVGEDSDGRQVVTFATNSATARREGGNELNLTFEEVTFCRRLHWADEYAGQPFIPAQAYADHGWWQYCRNCEAQVYEDGEDDQGNPLHPVFEGQHTYCSQSCKVSYLRQVDEANAKGEAFKARVLAERPDLTFTEFEAGWPRITLLAKFTFPGAKYGGSVRDQDGDGKLEWFIAQGDKAEWDYHQAQRQKNLPVTSL